MACNLQPLYNKNRKPNYKHQAQKASEILMVWKQTSGCEGSSTTKTITDYKTTRDAQNIELLTLNVN